MPAAPAGASPVVLFAVHIADGALRGPWLVGGFVLAGVLVALACIRIREEEIPRIAVLSSAFFVASSIHVPLFGSSIHLLLNGLVGMVLGPRSALAIALGLFLQALILSHGGLTALGVNVCVMALPALAVWLLFGGVRNTRPAWLASSGFRWGLGAFLGALAVALTITLNAFVLAYGGEEEWAALAIANFVIHLPIVVIEALIMGTTLDFLARVKPEMIGLGMSRPPWSGG
jgi:cobalt/nickel transport system permease protein